MANNNSNKLDRRTFLKQTGTGALVFVSGLAPSLWVGGCSKRRKRSKPNIIFIVVDTLRADHAGCCGYQRNTTPNIDSLSRQGMLFTNAIATAPWTLPSVGSILTSQYPCVLGIRDTITVIDKQYPLLSEVLKEHEYTTHGIVSHTLLSANLGFGRGFDQYDEKSMFGFGGISSPEVTKKVVSFLRRRHSRPFFLFAHYFDPHYNYTQHEKYNYYPSYQGELKSSHSILELWRMRHRLTKDDIKYLVSLYDSEIAFTDEYVGKVLDELKDRDYYDDSIIIVTSDHGEEFMERGWIGHTVTLYQELVWVPLIMKFPGCSPQIIDSSVSLIDIVPTIYQYLGFKVADALEGEVLDLSQSDSRSRGPIFSETFNPQVHQPKRIIKPIAFRSIVLGDRKLIYDEKKDTTQVYDLAKDPHERNDLSHLHLQQDQQLKVLLSRYIAYVKSREKPGPTQDANKLFTPEQRQQLESLGYL